MRNERDAALAAATTGIVVALVKSHRVGPDTATHLVTEVSRALRRAAGAGAPQHNGVQASPAAEPPGARHRHTHPHFRHLHGHRHGSLVTPTAVVCADCGWAGKSLKRHLAAYHDLTPDAYRARHGLSADHPLVAPSLSLARTLQAHRNGFGR